jgi:hypothetical protein
MRAKRNNKPPIKNMGVIKLKNIVSSRERRKLVKTVIYSRLREESE